MVTFRSNNNNNNRRPPFRSNNNRRPPFRSNNEGSKFSNNDNFRRSVPGRNNHNAVKLIEKYNDLAREALASEDKILSENYFQHADHFTRVQNEQESIRMARVNASSTATTKPAEASSTATTKPAEASSTATTKPAEVKDEKPVKTEANTVKKITPESVVKKVIKTIEKKTIEKKSVAS
jgi:hypothetical protein